jgi:hypothetical protein
MEVERGLFGGEEETSGGEGEQGRVIRENMIKVHYIHI